MTAVAPRKALPPRPPKVRFRAVAALFEPAILRRAAAPPKARKDTVAYRLTFGGTLETVPSTQLKAGDRVVVSASQVIQGDGDVIEGIAVVDESAITGESAPVIRESGGDRSAVTGGTIVLSDQITVEITSSPGETFLDRMIALVEAGPAKCRGRARPLIYSTGVYSTRLN